MDTKGRVTAGVNTAYLTANQAITLSGDATGTGTTAITVTLAASGVTAGTYNNSATALTPISVDGKGRVTGTSTPVTITPAWASVTGKPAFATVATSGAYSDLSGAPTIPTNTNQLTNGAGFITTSGAPVQSVNGATGAVTVNTIAGNAGTASKLAGAQTIAVSGDATGSASFDGSAAATISVALVSSGITAGTYNNSATAVQPLTFDAKGRATAAGAAVTVTPAWTSVTGKPTFATVATSGSYADLANLPVNQTELYYLTTGTFASNSTTFTNVAGLTSTSLAAGGTYAWEFIGLVTSSATSAGMGLRVRSSATSLVTCYGQWCVPQAASGPGELYNYSQTAESTATVSTAFPTASTYFVATGRGIVVLGASADTLSVQLASEISGKTMTVNTNACLRIRRIA